MCAALGACASTDSASTPTPSGTRLSDMFATPDWAKFTGAAPKTFVQPVKPDDLIGPDGACAAGAAAATETTALANSDGDANPAMMPTQPMVSGGIALQMTECQVAQRAGLPQKVDIGSNPGGERTARLTYLSGPWPGIYSFNGGRLASIDRVEVPEPPKTKKIAAPKKPPLRVNVGQ